MSKMSLASRSQRWELNVVSFTSSLYGQMGGTQTREIAVWFPTKLLQPDIQFDVVFRNERDYEDFQKFIRLHQQQASASSQLLNINWPQRNMVNWTGFIRRFEAGGMRWNIAPKASFVMELVDSFASSRTYQGSVSANWTTIFDLGTVGSVMAPAVGQEAQYLLSAFMPGQSQAVVTTGSTQPPTNQAPVIPQLPVSNILPGSGVTIR